MRGVRIKVGTIFMSSKLSANIAFSNPPSENNIAVSIITNKVNKIFWTTISVKNKDVIYVDNVDTDLDKDLIKNKMHELMIEAQSLEIAWLYLKLFVTRISFQPVILGLPLICCLLRLHL